jgi:large subunit ribosomal protein L2
MRAAGTSSVIILKQLKYVSIKLASGWQLTLPYNVMTTLGSVSNIYNKFFKFKKAGFKRRLGIRPTVRGVAMNPVDHPHGGGEGRLLRHLQQEALEGE